MDVGSNVLDLAVRLHWTCATDPANIAACVQASTLTIVRMLRRAIVLARFARNFASDHEAEWLAFVRGSSGSGACT
jgi:hypothetical protein